MGSSGLVSRRRVLKGAAAAAAALATTACTKADDHARRPQQTSRQLDEDETADVSLLSAAISDEEAIALYCQRAANAHPRQAALVKPIGQRQIEHVRGLSAALSDDIPLRRPREMAVPSRAEAASRKLGRLVAAAESDRAEDCMAARSGLLARLLASVSASHAVSLEAIRVGR